MFNHIKYKYSFVILILFMTQAFSQQVRFSRPMIAVAKHQPAYRIMLNGNKLSAPVIRDIIRIEIHERLNGAGNFMIKINNRDNPKSSIIFGKNNPFHQGDKIEILLVRDKDEPSRRLTKGAVTSVSENTKKPDSSFIVIEGFAQKPDITHQAITKSRVYKIDSSNRQFFTIKRKSAEVQVDVTWAERNEEIGFYGLRVGRKIRLDGIGETYDGKYYVTKVTHIFSTSGYGQSFELSRDGTNE